MAPEIKKIVAGALSGALAAVVIDVNAWSKSDAPFDLKLAFKRWIAGAISGIVVALGFGQVSP